MAMILIKDSTDVKLTVRLKILLGDIDYRYDYSIQS